MWSSDRRTLLLELSYLGRYFYGVEQQGERRTVASELQLEVQRVLGLPLRGLVFASRTDAGVSAEQNFATGWFRNAPRLPDLSALCRSQASALQIKRAVFVPRSLQARQCARQKHYQYRIVTAEHTCHDAWRVVPALDSARMKVAAGVLVGEHDFAAFRARSCQARTTVRTLYRVDVTQARDGILIDVEGDGFLKRMVRVIVGTLVAVGSGLQPPEQVQRILMSRDREFAGITAPAEGLTLKRIELLWPGQRTAGMPLLKVAR